MRSGVFRVIGGVLTALGAWALWMGVRDGDLLSDPYMLAVMAGGTLILGVYAAAGDGTANRMLMPIFWLAELPERAFAWVAERLGVEMPGGPVGTAEQVRRTRGAEDRGAVSGAAGSRPATGAEGAPPLTASSEPQSMAGGSAAQATGSQEAARREGGTEQAAALTAPAASSPGSGGNTAPITAVPAAERTRLD